jgi:isopenicillin N synthase-like dioxygenase
MAATAIHPNDGTREAALEAQEYLKFRLQPSSSVTSFRSIPIINLSPSFSASLVDRQSVAKEINEACTTIGFFYITGHGVESACPKALALAERFFSELSQDAKDKIHMKNSKYFRGYEPASYSSVNDFTTKETKEAFNWGYEAGLDPTGGDGKYVELDGEPAESVNIWPEGFDIPGFYEGIKEYYGQVRENARLSYWYADWLTRSRCSN